MRSWDRRSAPRCRSRRHRRLRRTRAPLARGAGPAPPRVVGPQPDDPRSRRPARRRWLHGHGAGPVRRDRRDHDRGRRRVHQLDRARRRPARRAESGPHHGARPGRHSTTCWHTRRSAATGPRSSPLSFGGWYGSAGGDRRGPTSPLRGHLQRRLSRGPAAEPATSAISPRWTDTRTTAESRRLARDRRARRRTSTPARSTGSWSRIAPSSTPRRPSSPTVARSSSCAPSWLTH